MATLVTGGKGYMNEYICKDYYSHDPGPFKTLKQSIFEEDQGSRDVQASSGLRTTTPTLIITFTPVPSSSKSHSTIKTNETQSITIVHERCKSKPSTVMLDLSNWGTRIEKISGTSST